MSLRRALRDWYEPRRSLYPWRGERDPYRILVSEVMLQQTQAPRVAPAYGRFVARFPTVRSLASASRAEVIRAWAGLGYNRRAVSLSEAARAIVAEHDGVVPSTIDELRRLPGVGPYTASAVAALAFGARVAAIDTNVRRVVARALLAEEPDDVPPSLIEEGARSFLGGEEPAAWNQAVMDIGRAFCRPVPACDGCPLAEGCAFRASGRSPRRSSRRQPAFEGSMRQARGAIVAALRHRRSLTLAGLTEAAGLAADRILPAVTGLARDGLVDAGPGALAGRPSGRVRLADSAATGRSAGPAGSASGGSRRAAPGASPRRSA